MMKEMGKGIKTLTIRFDEPIIITQRQDEGLVTVDHFIKPKIAIKD